MSRQNPARSAYLIVADEERQMRPRLVSAVSVMPFKRCPKCHFEWDTLTDFRKDVALRYIGRQAMDGASGLLMFNHSCGTTLSIEEVAENGYWGY